MGRRGFVFSVDTLFALFLALIILSGVYTLLSRENRLNFGAQDLQHHSMGALVALNQNDTLRQSVTQNKAEYFQAFLNNATPPAVCMNITIRNESMVMEQTYQKTNCTRGGYLVVSRRPLFVNNQTRIVSVEAWYS